MANPVNKALLEKYLDHQCTPAEVEQVRQFLQQPGNEGLLDALLQERLPADMQALEHTTTDAQQLANWKAAVHARMNAAPVQKGRLRRLPLLRRAAIWAAVFFGAGAYWLHHQQQQQQVAAPLALLEKQNPKRQRAVIHLTDGSEVLLGAGSKLQYPETFTGNTREIFLEGEAFFTIGNDPLHPFIVHTGGVRTTVLGTSFRISAFAGAPLTVAVATGKVRVDGTPGNAAVLTAGRLFTWNNDDHEGELKTSAVADIEGWKQARLVFDNKTLQEVAQELERWYDVKIVFKNPKQAAERITVTLFASAPLDKTLALLSAGSQFKYTVQQKNISIY